VCNGVNRELCRSLLCPVSFLQSGKLERPKHLSDETLNNVACIVMSLTTDSGTIATAKLVVKISDTEESIGTFTRFVFNPFLDE